MVINHNMQALNAHRALKVNTGDQSKSIEKLSSGFRINRAGDDAAGLAISEKMRGQIRGLNQASRNAQDGISLIQTAEGALNETHSILQRIRELTVQAANDTNLTDDRQNIADEVNQLASEVDRIATTTQFNQKTLLDGTFSDTSEGIKFQIGANSDQLITLKINSMTASGIAVAAGVSIINVASAISAGSAGDISALIDSLDEMLNTVSKQRSALGAVQNRLEHTINNLDTASENIQASESRIRDVDMALEMSNYTKTNILTQAATAMLAQANQAPQTVLQLLK